MATILNSVIQVVRAFQSLSVAIHSASSTLAHQIDTVAFEDEFGRFRVWSGNLGALQKGHSSLDYRLRDSPLLSSNALKLLEELKENLTQAHAVVSGDRLPYEQQTKPEEPDEDVDDDFYSEDEDDDSEAGVPKTELGQRFHEIVDIIDNLYKLSVRIRQPTVHTRSLKASAYRPKDPETGADILEQYAPFDLQHTRELIGHLRSPHGNGLDLDGDVLVDRLSKAITLRRRQFKYWKRHRDKLGASTLSYEILRDLPPTVQRPDALNQHGMLEVPLENPVVATLKVASSEKTKKTMLSGTEATHHHQSLDDLIDSKSVTSYATTVRDVSGRGVELPPPPKAADGEKDFECPYCFIICPARYGRDRSWRVHLLQDLQPYLCTYPECDHADQLFRSRREWSEHEATHRKAWRCPEHPTAVYNSRSGLEGHLRSVHADNIPEHQLPSIISVGETSTVDVRENCPICLADAGADGILGNLQNHIANHLERLASFALPSTAGMDDDSNAASGVASRGRTASSGSSQDLDGISVDSDNRHENDRTEHLDSATSDPLNSGVVQDNELVSPAQQFLSAESLGILPDSSQKRLDLLLSNASRDDSSDEQEVESSFAESEENPAETRPLKTYLLSLKGAKSVRFLRRQDWWRGYANFQDADSATQALAAFDSVRFPNVKISQGVKNQATLKFSLHISAAGVTNPLQELTETNEDSASSISLDYGEELTSEDKMPILRSSGIPNLHTMYRSGTLQQRDQSYAPNDSHNSVISLCFYDLTRIEADAVVNSANPANKVTRTIDSLNYYLHKAAGPGLNRECKAVGKMHLGEAKLTAGYDLPSQYVIHAARPHYSGTGMRKIDKLTDCYRNSLKLAMNHGIKTIAFPTLGAGGCGFPNKVAARVALQEVREFLDHYKGHQFEKIIFCVFNRVDEKSYKNLLPVFFPPTHGDLENAVTIGEPPRHSSALATQLQDSYSQVRVTVFQLLPLCKGLTINEYLVEAIASELMVFDKNMVEFPQSVFGELQGIRSSLRSLRNFLLSSNARVTDLTGREIADIDLICSVVHGVCGSAQEIVEQAKTRSNTANIHENIWKDYNTHLRSTQGADYSSLLELCQDFIQALDDVITRNGTEPYEMSTLRVRLGSYRLKQTGESHEGVRDHFEEVMYTREFQRQAVLPSRVDTIKLHQIPTLARLYQIDDLGTAPTNAIPDSRLNHIVCLVRDDITRIECDAICNSTDIGFSGMGTLDRTVFKKGGLAMNDAISKFGILKEGDVRVTPGFELPARHVIHAIPPDTYRSNTKDVLRKIYREILFTALSLKVTSLAIPTIGTGMLNYPRRDCASLAIEEVKRFLETADTDNPIEKIIFCVFGSNDDFVYKSLLPTYFPLVDSNVNKALRPGVGPPEPRPSHDRSMSNVSVESSPPRRTIFGSISEAFRTVRFGKQPVTQTSRPLQSAEQNALDNFEAHARDCPTCNNIAKLYAAEENLCADGYKAAQLILQYLHMGPEKVAYSTVQEGGKRVQVEIPAVYSKSWNLLITVEKSFRDRHRSRPFVSPNQPYSALTRDQDDTPPPGVTIHNAEVTIPLRTAPEKANAFVSTYSVQMRHAESLFPYECAIHIYPGRLEIYETDQQLHTQNPLLALELTSATGFSRLTSISVLLKARVLRESRVKTDKWVALSNRTPEDSVALFAKVAAALGHEHTPTSSRIDGSGHDSSAGVRDDGGAFSIDTLPEQTENTASATASLLAQRVLAYLRVTVDENLGADQRQIATDLDMLVADVRDACKELETLNLITRSGDDRTWRAVVPEARVLTLADQRPPALIEEELNKLSKLELKAIESPNTSLPATDLSTVNIDDFFTYLDLALDPATSSRSRTEREPRAVSRAQTFDPSYSYSTTEAAAPTRLTMQGHHGDEDVSSPYLIRNPRPTSPDRRQPKPIPPGARWTKINKRLVSPEALAEANEDFEEREDAVFVFRVIPREEIMKLAERTLALYAAA